MLNTQQHSWKFGNHLVTVEENKNEKPAWWMIKFSGTESDDQASRYNNNIAGYDDYYDDCKRAVIVLTAA